MADRRPRNKRPRNRGGKNRLAQMAATRRRNEHISALTEALAPEAEALAQTVDRDQVVDHIRAQATSLASQRLDQDVADVVEATLDEIFGLGPLEPLLRDSSNHAIRIEGADVYAEGEQVRGFRDAAHARRVVERILGSVGATLDSRRVEVTMMDGSSVRASLDGDVLTVDIVRP